MVTKVTMVTLEDIADYFETLEPGTVGAADRVYRPDARFKDPFNDVRGIAAIEAVYAHMFEQVKNPRFKVTGIYSGHDGVIMRWDFSFEGRAAGDPIRGASHLVLAADGRIREHVDYWDPAEAVYERVPVLGVLMRFLKRRLAAAGRS